MNQITLRDIADYLTPYRVLQGMTGVAFLVLVVLVAGLFNAPSQHAPDVLANLDEPVKLEEKVTRYTSYRIADLQKNKNLCLAALDEAGVGFRALPNIQGPKPYCSLRNRVSLDRSLYSYSAPVQATCAMTAALFVWEMQIVYEAAKYHLGVNVAEVQHLGVYSCRPMKNGMAGRSKIASEHASANAIDVKGFRLADGRVVDVKKHWGTKTPEGRFLKEVHGRSCHVFRGVLGPNYNALHRDHFHFDLGSYNVCK